jgi:hypothetical protein
MFLLRDIILFPLYIDENRVKEYCCVLLVILNHDATSYGYTSCLLVSFMRRMRRGPYYQRKTLVNFFTLVVAFLFCM